MTGVSKGLETGITQLLTLPNRSPKLLLAGNHLASTF